MKIDSKIKLTIVSFLEINTFLLFALTACGQTNDPSLGKSFDLKNKKKTEFIIGPGLLYPIGSFTEENNPRRIMAGYSVGIGFRKQPSSRFCKLP